MNTATPKISVVIPHYRDLHGLDLCLSALERQTYPRDCFEIIVADNNSPEGERSVAKIIAGRAKLVIVREKGAGPARNGGVAAASGAILAFTDADCQPEPEWLVEGLRALANFDMVGGRMKVLVKDRSHLTPEEAFETVFAFDNEKYVVKKGFTVTANLFCPRAAFDAVGGFLSAGIAEDLEWSHRARANGYRMGYAPASIVGHPARRSWDELLHKWRRANSDMYGLFVRRRGGKWLWFFRSFGLPLSALAHTPRVMLTHKLSSFEERVKALRILYRLRLWRFMNSLELLMREFKI